MEKEYRKTADLREWDKNPRTISPEGFEKLKKQLTKHKQFKPLIITADGVVLGGNMRLKAYRDLGVEELWVSVVDTKSEEEMVEIAFTDNDRAARYEFEDVLAIAEEFPNINWKDYAVDLQEAPVVLDVQAVHFLDTLFDRIDVNLLIPNKYSYRQHPEDQIIHLMKSIEQNGIYRNLIIAKDNTILDGHAVAEAAKRLGIKIVPVRRYDIAPESNQALKIVISNNELGKFAEVDDRKLTDFLKEVKEKAEAGLQGTGFTDQNLANLVMVTRPQSEINNQDTAAEWVGMPDFEPKGDTFKIMVNFRNVEDKLAFLKFLNEPGTEKTNYIWYPHRDKADMKSIRFE